MSANKTIDTIEIATPYYVLMDGKQRRGPALHASSSKTCVAIYGFSDKSPYDKFLNRSEQTLTPYPLVKRYLSSQIAAVDSDTPLDSCLKLVVLDAAGPDAPLLYATTMEAVLEAQENRTPQVAVSFLLSFDGTSATYQITRV